MSDLHQQVWEFIYDLLPEDEARELRDRISSDPEVAREYADVKLQTEVIARASRIESDQIVWPRPVNANSSDQSPSPAAQQTASVAWRRTASWIVSVAAAGLLWVMCSPLLVSAPDSSTQVADSAPSAATPAEMKAVRTVLVGSPKLNAESVNTFAVRMTTTDGEPVETEVASRFYDNQDRLAYTATSRTDASGKVLLKLPSTFSKETARIEVAPAEAWYALSRPLEVSDAKQVTYLRLDRPLFQPGDSVKFRSVTLSRLALQADAETEVRYFATGPDGNSLEPSETIDSIADGVGSGEFALPEDASEGSYAVVAQSPNQRFAEEWRNFEVRRFRTPRFKKKIELAKDSYGIGEMVEADFFAEDALGEAVANAEVRAEARFGNAKLVIPETKTDAKGAAKLAFRVPETLQDYRGRLSVTIGDSEGDETIEEDVRVNAGKVNVEFYPEGGTLVAGLPNRVYFYSRNPHGEPVHIEGRVAEGTAGSVAEVATIHEGRGVVSFTPQADVSYELTIEKPAGVSHQFDLPPVDAEQQLVMQTGSGVFAASDPIELTIKTKRPQTPLVVAGYCRGVMVGQLGIEESDYEVASDGAASMVGQLELTPDAQGVIRVTVFDGSVTPVVPIAERLVYRNIRKALHVNLSGQQKSYAPGSSVELEVAVTDENDTPQAATLGVSVVDDTILSLGKDKSTRLPTYFQLLTDIENPQDLEDANFYVSSEEGAEQALDLLLGTQGWRRFVEVPIDDLAANLDSLQDETSPKKSATGWQVGPAQTAFEFGLELPFVAEQQGEARPVVNQSVVIAEPKSRESAYESGMILVLGGAGLLLLLTLMGSMRTGLSFKVWGPAGALAAVALVIGLMSPPSPSERVGSITAVTAEPSAKESPADAGSESEEAVAFADDALFGREDTEQVLLRESDSVDLKLQQAERPAGETTVMQRLAADAPAQDTATISPPAPSPSAEPSAEPSAAAGAEAEAAPLASAARMQRSRSVERFSINVPEEVAGGAGALLGARRLLLEQRGVRDTRYYREYASFFERQSGSAASPSETQATVHWDPHLKLDALGKTTVKFNLPRRETTYRAIVEAHGSGRLGAAETLIISQSEE